VGSVALFKSGYTPPPPRIFGISDLGKKVVQNLFNQKVRSKVFGINGKTAKGKAVKLNARSEDEGKGQTESQDRMR
jgi:hypothetical protein